MLAIVLMTTRYTLEEPDEDIFRSMCEILFPGESTAERLRGLKESVWLDSSEPPVWTRVSNSGPGRDPIWRDWTPGSNAIVLGYYDHDHEKRKVVLFDRVIKRVEEEDELGERFGFGRLFRVVLVHELAHWLTWENMSAVETELSETLAELVSWVAFSKLPEDMGKAEALGCQHWLNQEAPTYWYRTYWPWLLLCRRMGTSPWDLSSNLEFLQRLLACSQKHGHTGFLATLARTLSELPKFKLSKTDIPPGIRNPWEDKKLTGYEGAFDRLIQERDSAIQRDLVLGDDGGDNGPWSDVLAI